MERKKWAINDGPSSPSQSLHKPLRSRQKAETIEAKPYTRTNHSTPLKPKKGPKWVVKRTWAETLGEKEKRRKEEEKKKSRKGKHTTQPETESGETRE